MHSKDVVSCLWVYGIHNVIKTMGCHPNSPDIIPGWRKEDIIGVDHRHMVILSSSDIKTHNPSLIPRVLKSSFDSSSMGSSV